MPPHKGHQLLVTFAKSWVEKLYVVVESVENETIPSTLRVQWMKELFPACEIVHLDIHHPQDPSETNECRTSGPEPCWFPFEPIDFVFASELYGQRIASIFNATFIPVDIPGESVEISATKIRRDPMRYWRFYSIKCARFLSPESECIWSRVYWENNLNQTIDRAL